jgi:4-hydroxybutyryl-CoA dehydratase / vinylacetyl-CoA-Delta-isomerase
MPLKSKQEYIESLKAVRPSIFYEGQKIEDVTTHPLLQPTIENIGITYEMAQREEEGDLFAEFSPLIEAKVNRYCHVPQSREQMVKRIKMDRRLGNLTGLSNYRSTGADVLNCLESMTLEIDQAKGTSYHKRFTQFLSKVQSEDLSVGGTVTDPKGDRSLRPSEQEDPDLYVHVVGETPEGIIVKGAKANQSGAGVVHELVVMPTRAMTAKDHDYAVAFAVPNNAPGLFQILSRQPGNAARVTGGPIDHGNHYAGHETLVVFNEVFIPWERVFMLREWEFSGKAVERFASYHRICYSGAVVGYLDVVIGAAALMAKMNGVFRASHVQEKLAEMISLNETIHACGLAAAHEGRKAASGAYLMNDLFANLCKLNITRMTYDIFRMAHDLTGGMIATSPSETDLRDPELGPFIQKYMRGASSYSAEDRIRVTRLIEAISFGPLLGVAMHGSGSPQAQKITITRQKDITELMDVAANLAGLQKR